MNTTANTPIHFVTGLGRSGTTLLSQSLNGYTEAVATPESLFLLHFLKKFGKQADIPVHHQQSFRHAIFRIRSGRFVHLGMWHINRQRLHDAFQTLSPPVTYRAMATQVYACSQLAVLKPRARVIIDKNPPYARHLQWLLQTFPESRAVCLVRDPRDTSVSRKAYHMDPFSNPVYQALVWRYFARRMRRAQSRYPQRIRTMRYEEMISDFQRYRHETATFFGIDPANYSAEHEKQVNSALHDLLISTLSETEMAWFRQMHGKVWQPVDPSQAGKWHHHLPRHKAAAIAYVCRREALALGYQFTPSETRISAGARLSIPFFWLLHQAEVAVHQSYYHSPLWLRSAAGGLRRMFRRNEKSQAV
jgi:hypothetical protein